MRVKTGPYRRHHHQKVLARTRGMRLTKGKLYKVSHEADLHRGQYEYIGRRLRKRDLRRLWIQRINAGLNQSDAGLKYSHFINLLKEKKIALNRKMLADLAVTDPGTFKFIISQVGEK